MTSLPAQEQELLLQLHRKLSEAEAADGAVGQPHGQYLLVPQNDGQWLVMQMPLPDKKAASVGS